MRTMPTISSWIVMGACGLWRAEAGAQPVRTPPATLPFKLPARGEYGPPLIGPERRADEPSRAQRWDGMGPLSRPRTSVFGNDAKRIN